MFDHIGIHAHDLAASIAFYEAALAPLGFELCSHDDASAGFGPKNSPALWIYKTAKKPANGAHLAFSAKDHAAVDQFHAKGVKAHGRDNGAPGIRADYSPKYYAAFLIDPDGNNVEAVCST